MNMFMVNVSPATLRSLCMCAFNNILQSNTTGDFLHRMINIYYLFIVSRYSLISMYIKTMWAWIILMLKNVFRESHSLLILIVTISSQNFYFFQECDSNYKHQWTNNNNLQCSDNNLRTRNDRCVNGACVGTPYNCLACETHDGSGCPIQSGYCVIQHGGNRTCFAKNQYKPGNRCQVGL